MRFSLCSNANSIVELEDIVQSIARKYEIPTERYSDVLISLTEAVNNAIRHGNKFDDSKNVLITSTYKNNEISFMVSDEGNGFSPDHVANPTSTAELMNRPGGRGIYLMKNLCDKLTYFDNGTKVEIKFFLRD